MLYRLLWHAGRYRIPEVLAMTLLECAIALGVDQAYKPNLPFGHVREDHSEDVADAMQIPTEVMIIDPRQLQAAISFQAARP